MTAALHRNFLDRTISFIDCRIGVCARSAEVFCRIERQISTKLTGFQALDKQNPRWQGSGDLADTTLEKDILNAVKQRLGGS